MDLAKAIACKLLTFSANLPEEGTAYLLFIINYLAFDISNR